MGLGNQNLKPFVNGRPGQELGHEQYALASQATQYEIDVFH
jgi:hypothetical protein